MLQQHPLLTREIGYYVTSTLWDETVRCFVPHPLPPVPPLDSNRFFYKYSHAASIVGELKGLTQILPDPEMFIFSYQQKEAVVSSQIEGTQSSLSDILADEKGQTEEKIQDFHETSNYIKSLNHAKQRMEQDGLPLSSRLLCECHAILLSSGRGSDKQPGEFRRSQNWIGGSRPGTAHFVPPPPGHVAACMSDLEKFLNAHRPDAFYDTKGQNNNGQNNNGQNHAINEIIPSGLLRAALAHVQFETIHPFLDGNGRVGRMLILLILIEAGDLDQPILYLSLWFKKHRDEYYRLLSLVRETGEWEIWLEFFLDGVIDTAGEASQSARKILTLFADDRQKIIATGINSPAILKIFDYLRQKIFITASQAAKATELSFPTVNNYLQIMTSLGIVSEFTGKSRDRIYHYTEYFNILKPGTDPLPRY
ncbi:MAG: Fic family protein [Candidatus Symbiobacter sp.]|nr:Fic family protein [Candidatus Symbiobacter sp.]